MIVQLKADNKNILFLDGSEEINANDDFVQSLIVLLETPLNANERLSVVFFNEESVTYELDMLVRNRQNDSCIVYIPQALINSGGAWNLKLLRHRQAYTGEKTTASNDYPFNVGAGVKNINGENVTTAELQTAYNEIMQTRDEAQSLANTAGAAAASAQSAAETARQSSLGASSAANYAETKATQATTAASEAAQSATDAEQSRATAAQILNTTDKLKWQAEKAASDAQNAAEIATNAVSGIEGLPAQIEAINTVLEQSGLVSKYKATIEDTYTERVTADGANVLDGSKAKLEKVVGNSVASKNLFNPFVLSVQAETDTNWIKSVTSSEIVIGVKKGYVINTGKTLQDFCPALKIGQTVWLNGESTGYGAINLSGTISTAWFPGESITITKEYLTATVSIPLNADGSAGDVTITNLRITESQNEPFTPYFTGLKSASFAGIESGGKNLWNGTWETGGLNTANGEEIAQSISLRSSYVEVTSGAFVFSGNIADRYGFAYDKDKKFVRYLGLNISKITFAENEKYIRVMQYNSTVEPTNIQLEQGKTETDYTPYISPYLYAFPKTETPLGVTIDFENKKITDYGVEIDGNYPNISYSSSSSLFTFSGLTALIADRTKAVSSYYTYDNNGGSVRSGTFWITSDGTDLRIRDSRFTSVNELKAWMDENNVKIRYVSSVLQSETDFTAEQSASGNEYTAYNGGTETVLDNDGKDYGADNTLSQNYIIVTGVK